MVVSERRDLMPHAFSDLLPAAKDGSFKSCAIRSFNAFDARLIKTHGPNSKPTLPPVDGSLTQCFLP